MGQEDPEGPSYVLRMGFGDSGGGGGGGRGDALFYLNMKLQMVL